MPIPPHLHDLARYLKDIGYADLYHDQIKPKDREKTESQDSGDCLTNLAATVENCKACALSQTRNRTVFGSGSPRAELMFVGEGPGAEEDRQGLPFVGPAGQLLTKIIEAIGLERKDTYIANIVKCRPPGNRDPQREEVAACAGFLREQIRIINPRCIVALGRVAAHSLLQTEGSLRSLRGRWHQVYDTPVRVTYHPAALLRNQDYKRPTWEDMRVVRDWLGD